MFRISSSVAIECALELVFEFVDHDLFNTTLDGAFFVIEVRLAAKEVFELPAEVLVDVA